MNFKKEMATERRERFLTGGGSGSNAISNSTPNTGLVGGVLSQQLPLNGIWDNDHVDSGKLIIILFY